MSSKKADLLLLIVAILWGLGYIFTDVLLAQGLNSMTLIGVRFLIASIFLMIIFHKKLIINKLYITGSFFVGLSLFLAFFSQTKAMEYTTTTNVSVLTSVNIVFVPLIMFIFYKKNIKIKHIISVILTILGILFLTNGIDDLNIGDILTLICAFLFAVHIVLIAHYSKKIEIYNLAIYQMFVVGIIGIVFSLFLNLNIINQLQNVSLVILLFEALIPSALCFLLQNIGLKYTDESRGSLILASESLWGAIFAVLLLNESLTLNIIIGGSLIFIAIVIDEIKFKKRIKYE